MITKCRQWSFGAWIGVVVATIGLSRAVSAADDALRLFDFEPRVTATETYSDGGTISSGSSGGWVTSVNPGFSLSRQAARLNTDIDYALSNRYFSDTGQSDVRHRLHGSALLDVIERELFLDAFFSKRDQLISPFGTVNIDPGLQRDNLTSSTSWGFGPRWLHRFGSVASSTLDYQVNRVSFDGDVANDSFGTNLLANLSSGSLFETWFWALDYSSSEVRFSRSDDRSEFERYSATVGYNVTRKLNVFYTLGNDRNRYARSVGETGGGYWNVGIGFTPSVRTSLQATFGKRFYGDTSSFSFNHQARKWTITAAYDETVTNIRQQQLRGIFFICPPEIPDCTPEEAIAFGLDIGVRDGTYIQESLTGSLTYALAKSSLTLSTFDRQRLFRDGSGPNDKTAGVTLGWNWKMGPRTSVNVGTGWTQYEFLTTPVRQDDRWFFRAGLQRSLASDLHASLNYNHQSRTSNVSGVGKGGNTVSASLTKTF